MCVCVLTLLNINSFKTTWYNDISDYRYMFILLLIIQFLSLVLKKHAKIIIIKILDFILIDLLKQAFFKLLFMIISWWWWLTCNNNKKNKKKKNKRNSLHNKSENI